MGLMPNGEPLFLDPEPLRDPQSAAELFGPSPAMTGTDDGMVGPLPDGSGFFVADVEVDGPCAECERRDRIAMMVGVGIGAVAAGAVFWFVVRNRGI